MEPAVNNVMPCFLMMMVMILPLAFFGVMVFFMLRFASQKQKEQEEEFSRFCREMQEKGFEDRTQDPSAFKILNQVIDMGSAYIPVDSERTVIHLFVKESPALFYILQLKSYLRSGRSSRTEYYTIYFAPFPIPTAEKNIILVKRYIDPHKPPAPLPLAVQQKFNVFFTEPGVQHLTFSESIQAVKDLFSGKFMDENLSEKDLDFFNRHIPPAFQEILLNRYGNFPFTKINPYENSYVIVGRQGLMLLCPKTTGSIAIEELIDLGNNLTTTLKGEQSPSGESEIYRI